MNKNLNHSIAKVGSVLIVGGGIAGIQSALDLAEQGFKVYLVESSPSIGGVMAQLDKTFPTNDCSMCILSPKLVECGRHLNIEVITYSEVIDIEGEPGNFRVKIRKKARYIDPTKCTGCGECQEVCPVKVPSEFDEKLRDRKAIYRPFPQAYPNIFTIEKKLRPCQITCPSGVHAQGYIALIKQKKYKEAVDLVRKNNPLPAICGRICTHPCETQCKRGVFDEPVAIDNLKRFVADWEFENNIKLQIPEIKDLDKKVAIIGSGPAGLTCAYYLRLKGYKVTIFEALSVLGGMLKVGIPDYRLPSNILEKEIDTILNLGVEVKTNVKVGKDLSIEDIFKQGYNAIFIATGAHKSLKLNIPNEDADGVVHGVDFLRNLNLEKKVKVGKKVAIIGGGNVAIDAARSAWRLGAEEITILYRRTKKEMPASEWEIEEAEEEGIKIQFLVAPKEVIVKNKKVAGLKCVRMKLGEPDASGRRRPFEIPGSEFVFECDMIIPAIGQMPDASFLEGTNIKTDRGIILVDKDTLMTSQKGVFAGGDVVLGPATAIEAIAAGKKAAESIDAYLKGEKIKNDISNFYQEEINYGDIKRLEHKKREKMPSISVKERKGNFKEVQLGYNEEQALKEAERCLSCGVCSECLECEKVCKAGAIVHKSYDEIKEIEVGAIILSVGFDEYNPEELYNYGYKKYRNVVTSIEFERILNASGPYGGEVVRPSDKKHPKNIAFIQCVGSRDEKFGQGYCSSVCCMYAIKEAIIAKEHTGGNLDTTIFFMDMRCYGKDFDKYYERAQKEYGVKFVRSKVYKIEELNGSGNLNVVYVKEDGKKYTEKFDMVVLSVGFLPKNDAVNLAKKMGLNLNKYNFIQTKEFKPIQTLKEGIYVCGAFSGPKDIPETVIQASAAASQVSVLLSDVRKTLTKEKIYPQEINVVGQDVRIGVFVCHCGINIGGVVNVPEVRDFAKNLPNVVYCEDNLYTCSQDTQEKIKEKIKEYNLNRVVVASCSPRTHEPLFQETIREAGLNKYLFEMANIRDQCSWVHMHEKEKATEKAKDLVKMAVAKARMLEPLKELKLDVVNSALVIGGGISGMVSSLNLAEQGFKVYLIEKNSELGGLAKKIKYTLDGKDVEFYLNNLIERVKNNKNIEIITEAKIVEITGYVGNFKIGYTKKDAGFVDEIKAGAIIVAVGAEEYKPTEYLYGKDKRVITQLELEEKLFNNTITQQLNNGIMNVVMIQCVGSRNSEHPYCSRFCCQQAIKNALKLKEINPKTEVYILYRDIRTYGFSEDYYHLAREKGVIFIRYEEGGKPEVKIKDGKLIVETYDQILGEKIEIPAELLVLSVGAIPYPENKELASLLKVPLNQENFFLEAHVKLRPVDFATDGVFLAGLCHSPKTIEECISQSQAAAGRAATILVKDKITTSGIVSYIDENKCAGCKICVSICPYKAIEFDETKKVSRVNEATCKGCGTCASTCPSGAASALGFKDEQIFAQIRELRDNRKEGIR
jgi:heterodisulfide reductase subunit A-like polyferredoxin